MCLQRTGAEHVNARFEDLVRVAHSPADLIANESEARRLMESHGLHWGMDNILKLAHALVDQFGGKVPASRQELLTLPGVGDYVANAVLCFGFEKPSILMDSNTARIASRVMGHGRSSRRWQLRLDLYRLAGSGSADAEFNYALLDLAAMVCRPTSPRCLVCPVARHCQTFRDLDS
jgi:A/G-specific adenine glycosylase